MPCLGYSSSFITFSPFEFFIVTGIISCWKYPFFCAFSVFCWDSAAYLSCSSLDIEYFTATFSAESINISKLLKWTNNSEQYYISLPFIQNDDFGSLLFLVVQYNQRFNLLYEKKCNISNIPILIVMWHFIFILTVDFEINGQVFLAFSDKAWPALIGWLNIVPRTTLRVRSTVHKTTRVMFCFMILHLFIDQFITTYIILYIHYYYCM